MNNPLETLIFGILIIFIISVFIWPDKGVVATWKKAKKQSLKIQIEDALKHLYDFEEKSISITLHSLAGYLGINGDEVASIAETLKEMKLITIKNEKLNLTSEGRAYALKIIRVHRLWESYLAEETGIKEKDWHIYAEDKEHYIDQNEADLLAAKMGNPSYDPHGDPIPTSDGEVPTKKGILLTEIVDLNKIFQIVHIEDEPQAIYSQIIAEGLFPGMQIRVIEISKERIKFIAEGEECILSPLIAANLTVVPLLYADKIKKEFKTLSSLGIGEEGEIVGISKACRGQQRRRLLDFGLVPGTKIIAELESIGKDPIAFNIRGASIALRKSQTNYIYIK